MEGKATLEHPEPGPHSEFYPCQGACIAFQHLVLHFRPLAPHRDHLDTSSGRAHVFC